MVHNLTETNNKTIEKLNKAIKSIKEENREELIPNKSPNRNKKPIEEGKLDPELIKSSIIEIPSPKKVSRVPKKGNEETTPTKKKRKSTQSQMITKEELENEKEKELNEDGDVSYNYFI